jgi:protein-S-isoprenylcysteine O-methyltransferase Ste14
MLSALNIRITSIGQGFDVVSQLITMVAVVAVLMAVAVDFTQFHRRSAAKKEVRSVVETGSMIGFFIVFYLIIRFQILMLHSEFSWWTAVLSVVGCSLLIVGSVVNILGRLQLGKNWSNQIVVYKDSALVTNGLYSLVRHPLYASLIWMFFGASLVYLNPLAFLANTLIFIPFMHYRARQEESVLQKEFPEYAAYAARVRRFTPQFSLPL